MPNFVTLRLRLCEPAPVAGYRVTYRPQGSSEPLRVWPVNFFTTPIVFQVTADPDGTQYEGFVQGDCGPAGLGVEIPWQTGTNDHSSGSASASTSEPPPPTGAVGTITAFDCGGGGSITDVKFNGVSIPLVSASYPVGPGQTATTEPIPFAPGVLEVFTSGEASRVRVIDGFFTVSCQNYAGAGTYEFDDFFMNAGGFTVELDCFPC